MPEIDIAVAAYNCASWIDAFFESLLSQNFTDWRVVARDDASTDDTASRLISWQSRLGRRMTLVTGPHSHNLGIIGNYDAILAATTARFVMFGDPDDVWLPGKIATTVRAMRNAEAARQNVPIVVCTDAQVVDEHLNVIAPSYWNWSRMNPARSRGLPRLAVESPALGPTMMMNRPLLDLALPLTGAASCSDWWPALVAGTFGEIVYLPEKTILYRRHASNDSLEPLSTTIPAAIRRLFITPDVVRRRTLRLIRQFAPQADAFVCRFRDRLSPDDIAALEAAARLPALSAVSRRWAVVRHGLWFASPIKNVGLAMLL